MFLSECYAVVTDFNIWGAVVCCINDDMSHSIRGIYQETLVNVVEVFTFVALSVLYIYIYMFVGCVVLVINKSTTLCSCRNLSRKTNCFNILLSYGVYI